MADHKQPDTGDPLAQGATVYDESTGRYGTVSDIRLSRDSVFLRPLGGGVEWTARREHLRPAATSDLLAERLRSERSSAGGSM
jgi:hypothetical protein